MRGAWLHGLQFKAEGLKNTHREVTYLQLGSPAICMRVTVYMHMQKNGLLYLLPTPTQTNHLIINALFK